MLGKQPTFLKKIIAMTVVMYLILKVMIERVLHKCIAPNYKDDANKQ